MSLCFRNDIMANYWKDDPNLRPSFENLREELKEMENQHKVAGLRSLHRSYLIFYLIGLIWHLQTQNANYGISSTLSLHILSSIKIHCFENFSKNYYNVSKLL